MNRSFDTHIIRDERSLDGVWDFCMEGFEKTYKMSVPGCWEQHPDFTTHQGKGRYTRVVNVAKDSNIRLEFKGVSHTADVYFDGELVGHHYNAFTPFVIILKDVKKGEHTLSVEVDNRFSEASALHIPNDYYTYGGIIRPVTMEYIGDSYIKYIHFTSDFEKGRWSGRTEVCIVNLSDDKKTVELKTSLAGVENKKSVELCGKGETICSFENEYEGITPWSGKNPQLYLLKAEIDGDDLIERIGFRKVTLDKTRLFVNDEPIFLKGVNRHEDYATVGCAIPPQLMSVDLDLIQDLGANSVRTSHYPNDERFLDMCDERGIFVWEENHARGLTLEQMQNPNFEKQCEDCIAEMIENHYNHPSIVIWGILNECSSETPEGAAMYKRQYEQIKSLDQTRPTTSASNKYYNDVSLGYPDIVSYNIYNGWYFDIDEKEDLNKMYDWIQTTEGKDKPMIISEFGAGGIYGYRDRTCVKWSEERQAEILASNINAYLNNDKLTGIYIWLFADCRVDEKRLYGNRPKTQNNKGLVDLYRREKLAYDRVKNLFNEN